MERAEGWTDHMLKAPPVALPWPLGAVSSRYRLPANASAGDVSLSILRSTRADSGFYHCRVQVPGLFNDHIHSVHLIVTEGQGRHVKPYRTNGTRSVGISLYHCVVTQSMDCMWISIRRCDVILMFT